MFKWFSITGHAALLVWFIVLQVQGNSIFGSDESTGHSSGSGGGSRSSYHK